MLNIALLFIRCEIWIQVALCRPGRETRTSREICSHQLPLQNQWEEVSQGFIQTWRHQETLLLWKLRKWQTKHTWDFSNIYGPHTKPFTAILGFFDFTTIAVVLQGMYAVVEFSSQESVASLLEGAIIPTVSHESMVPFKSRLLSLKNFSLDSSNQQAGQQRHPQTTPPINELMQRLSREESVSAVPLPDWRVKSIQIDPLICNTQDNTSEMVWTLGFLLISPQIDHQITHLTESYQLTEENIRLRFLVCSLLKDIAAAYFPECTIKPFGSSVNGFGKLGCDLDMFLDLDGISGRNVNMVIMAFGVVC